MSFDGKVIKTFRGSYSFSALKINIQFNCLVAIRFERLIKICYSGSAGISVDHLYHIQLQHGYSFYCGKF